MGNTGADLGALTLEALKGLKTINEIGQEYGVHPVQKVGYGL